MTPFARAALLAPLLAASPGAAADIHVDFVRGSDAGTGAPEAPLFTAQIAVNRAAPGDTIHFHPSGAVARQALLLRGKVRLVIEGNDTVLTGADPLLPDGWEDLGGGLARRRLPRTPMDRHLLVIDGATQRMGRSPTVHPAFPPPEALGPGQFAWQSDGEKHGWLYVRGPRAHLEWSTRLNGLAMQSGNRDILVRNLHCRHALNDGFNIHGDNRDLRFENITGRDNFDEGFSAHETSQCRIENGRFSGNDNAAADIGESETSYARCEFRDSVSKEIYFQGGRHALDGCSIVARGACALLVEPGPPAADKSRSPVACRLTRCDIATPEGPARPVAAHNATVAFENCTLRNVRLDFTNAAISASDTTLDGRALAPDAAPH